MELSILCFTIAACCNTGFAFGACDKNKTANTPSSRFTLSEGEAFDRKTGLTWSRCSVGTTWKNGKCIGTATLMSLSEAKQYAEKLGSGWRVPSIEELYGIVEPRCSNPAINSEVFPGIKNSGEGATYWSTTRIKEIPSLVYYVDFLTGETDGHSQGFAMAIRLVHGKK